MKRESEKISSGLEGLSVRAAHERTDITVALFRNGYIATSGGAKPRRIARRELKAPVIIGSSTRHSLVFYRTGTATPASIEIRYGDRSCRIALSLRGRITRGC